MAGAPGAVRGTDEAGGKQVKMRASAMVDSQANSLADGLVDSVAGSLCDSVQNSLWNGAYDRDSGAGGARGAKTGTGMVILIRYGDNAVQDAM